jgi:hypothetical protein
VGIIATIALLGAYAPTANAYVLGPCTWPHTTGQSVYLWYQWGGQIDAAAPDGISWRQAFVTGANNWTYSATLVYVQAGGANYTFDTYSAPNGTYGTTNTVWNTQTATCTYVQSSGNRGHQMTQYEAGDTAGHEIGHGLTLGESLDASALMYSAYNGVMYPQADDINGVNAMYP